MFSASLRCAVFAASLLGAGLLWAPAARAQARLSFTGGSGTPLNLILTAPVTYKIITASPSTAGAPLFIFSRTGNFIPAFTEVRGTITYSINDGAAQTLNFIQTGTTVGSVGPNDLYGFGAVQTLAVGDNIVLKAGTLTTTSNFTAVRPADSSFTTFLVNGNGVQISQNGTLSAAAPEPGSFAVLLPTLSVTGFILRHRKNGK